MSVNLKAQKTFDFPTPVNAYNQLNVTEVHKRDNWLELKIVKEDSEKGTCLQSVHKINNSLSISIRVLTTKTAGLAIQQYNQSLFGAPNNYAQAQPVVANKILLLFKFVKTDSEDDAVYSIVCNSIGLGLLDKSYSTDNDSWFLVYETGSSTLSFNIIFRTKIIKSESPFKALYEDTELVDLKLVGEGGAEVLVHGAVLAAQSPAVMKMIQDKTIKDKTIEYSEVKEKTLRDFKSYIYLKTLPTEDIEQLLIFASRASMGELERKCIRQILAMLTGANVYRLTQFAQQHNIHELYLKILEYIQNGKVKVCDVRNCLRLPQV